jgi:hypothetical protein
MADPSVTIPVLLLKNIIATNEVGSLENAYFLSHAGTAKSGFSVGAFQSDLAYQASARQTVENYLSQSKAFDAADLAAIDQGFLSIGNPDAIASNVKTIINALFSTSNGRSLINGLDAAQLDALIGSIAQALGNAQANPRYVSDGAFKVFSDSNFFQALIGDNANQYGPPNTFGRYIQGQAVTVGGDTLELGSNPWDFAAFASYEAHYSYVRSSEQGATDMRRRRTNIVNILAANNALGDENQADCLNTIQTVYQAVG